MRPFSTTCYSFLKLATVRRLLTILMLTGLVHAASSAQAVAIITVIDDFTEVASPSPWLASSGQPPNYNGLDGLDLRLDLPFSNPIPPNPNGVTFPKAYDESGLNTANVLGGTRRSEFTITASSPPQPQFGQARINVLPAGTGIFDYTTGPTVVGNTSLIYNGLLPDGASTGTMFVRFNSYDMETDSPLTVRMSLDDGGGGTGQIERTLAFPIDPIGGDLPVDVPLPLGLGEFAGVDFSGSLKLSFTFFGNMADDFALEQITLESTSNGPSVPEPSTWALGMIGLASLAGYGLMRHRRRNKPQATSQGESRSVNQGGIFKKLSFIVLALAAVLASESNASAVLLSDLLSGGDITVGPLRFYNFGGYSSEKTPSGSGINPANISVVPDPSPPAGELGLLFHTPTMAVTPGQTLDTRFFFDVEYVGEGLITDNSLRFTASQVNDGMAYVIETVTDPDDEDNETATLATKMVIVSSDFNQVVDHRDFTRGSQIIHIEKDVALFGGEAGAAAISDFSQTFSFEGSHVPEPSTWALFGLGLVGLTGWGWRRSRRGQ
jgi:hypothetical protein